MPAPPSVPATSSPENALPAVELAQDVPATAVLAVPTVGSDDGAVPAGSPPVDTAPALLRESATGAAGEVVSLPVDRPQGTAAQDPATQDPATRETAAQDSERPSGDAGDDGPVPLERVVLLGVGGATPADLRKAGAALARAASDSASLAVDLHGLPLEPDGVAALVEGLLLASYSFSRAGGASPRALQTVHLVGPVDAGAVEAAVAVCAATAVARDLVNTPSLEKSPDWLAGRARQLLDGLDVTVLDEVELAARGYGGILGVGQGSSRPPRLVEATWDGGGSRHVVLVGKGITFDTGGLSLKPNPGMWEMKSDMGGAAAVLATLRAVADLRLPIRVTVLAAVAENMPSGTAQRPGDVLTQYGGRTVEVLNTDAEGRLVLADALAHGDLDLDADVLVDVATLTGAMPVALGKRTAGLFSSDDALAAQLEAASRTSGEQVWRMPLVEDYRSSLDSPIADLRNIGRPKLKLMGGSITAALFLREFTGGRPWAHLDIAGVALAGGDDAELVKGGTGFGVRLLTAWLTALAAEPAATSGRATTEGAATATGPADTTGPAARRSA